MSSAASFTPRYQHRTVRAACMAILAILLCGLGYQAWQSVPEFSRAANIVVTPSDTTTPVPAGDHPLVPILDLARSMIADMKNVHDYSCELTKREWVDGGLTPKTVMFAKVRHEPFSVYLKILSPPEMRGQEVIYVEGRNDGNMLAHTTGLKHRLLGTVKLSPTSMVAMEASRYPVTRMGLLKLLERLVEVGKQDLHYGECQVNVKENVVTDDGSCRLIEVVHPVRRPYFLYQAAKIYIDPRLNVPVRFEAYEWPDQPNGEPQLIEEYVYSGLKLNNGFTDADFDSTNPAYAFSRSSRLVK